MTVGPFFEEFNRLMPDVPVVLLPPESPAPEVELEPVDRGTASRRATAAREAAAGRLEALWATASAGRSAPDGVHHAWDAGDAPGWVRARSFARHGGAVDDPRADLTTVADRLTALGFAVRGLPIGGGGARLVAELDHTRVEVLVWGQDGPWDVAVSVPAAVGEHEAAVRTSVAEGPWGQPVPGVDL